VLSPGKGQSIGARPGQKSKTRSQKDEADNAKHNEWPAVLHGACARFGPDRRWVFSGLGMDGGHILRDCANEIESTKIEGHTPYQAHEGTPGHKNLAYRTNVCLP
jgi:hypothetical protein